MPRPLNWMVIPSHDLVNNINTMNNINMCIECHLCICQTPAPLLSEVVYMYLYESGYRTCAESSLIRVPTKFTILSSSQSFCVTYSVD